MKKSLQLLHTPDEELIPEQRRVKSNLKLLNTPDEQLTPEQKKAKKHLMRQSGDKRYMNDNYLALTSTDTTTAGTSSLLEHKHWLLACSSS
jgi:hypothetical protein